jgi:hypothetical protein
MDLKVMVTGADTPAGRCLVDALNAEGVELVECDCDAAASGDDDCHFTVHRSDSPEFVGDLVTLCLKHEVDVLVPMRASDLSVIARVRSLFECIGAHVWPDDVPPKTTASAVQRILELGEPSPPPRAMSRWFGRFACHGRAASG